MKNKIITISFIVVLFGLFFTNLIVKDIDVSISERRKLAKFPEFSMKNILDGINSRLNEAEEQISELEDRIVEVTIA